MVETENTYNMHEEGRGKVYSSEMCVCILYNITMIRLRPNAVFDRMQSGDNILLAPLLMRIMRNATAIPSCFHPASTSFTKSLVLAGSSLASFLSIGARNVRTHELLPRGKADGEGGEGA